MTALYSVAEIRTIEHAALASLPLGTLMQRAGKAAAKAALELVTGPRDNAKVLVLAGPGNNGGDAIEAAIQLVHAGLQVSLLLYADAGKQSPDAQHALQRAQENAVPIIDPRDPSHAANITLTRWALVIDGLFGIGLTRPIAGEIRDLIETVNNLECPLLALDVPSGLDAESGSIVGQHGIAVRASHTITFIADKPGLHTCHGRDYAGIVRVANLDIERQHFPQPQAQLNHIHLFAHQLQRRRHNSHKGSYGNVAVIGGALGMGGAALLAARAALHCGAGRVYVGFVDVAPAYDSQQLELMCRPAHELAQSLEFSSATLVVGPGLGTSSAARELLVQALAAQAPLVLDADALNLLALEGGLQQTLLQRGAATVLTPHPLEAARLLGTTSVEVQADRLAAARALARQCNATIVLKGSGTVLAGPNGNLVINPTGNPALATAGSGDVLAGLCGALLVQGWPGWEAALAAVWLHGSAADMLVRQGAGPVGLTAGELIPVVRSTLNRLIDEYA